MVKFARGEDDWLAGEPSFTKATDGRGSAVNIIQTLAECHERRGGVLAVLLRADCRAERVVREVPVVAETVADARHAAGLRVVDVLDGSVNFAAGEND